MKLTDLEYETIRDARLAELETLFEERTEEGVLFFVSSANKEVQFQANEKSVVRISAAIQQINVLSELGITTNQFQWTARDNSNHTLTILELKQLGLKIGEHFTNCHFTKCRVRQSLLQNLDIDIYEEWG